MAGNGDILGLALEAHDHQTGQGRVLDPSFGPVIASAIRFADKLDGVGSEGGGLYLEDAGYPEFINWLAQTADLGGTVKRAIRFALHWIKMRVVSNPTSDLGAAVSRLLGDGNFTRSSLPLLGMGRDVPDGRATINGKGHLDLDWSIKRSEAYFERARTLMRETAEAMGAKYDDGPIWRLSRALTVHPLGGCPMGTSPKEGVVDSHGQVFNYPGFFIADGSILPGPVGPNPALTIAACANRAAQALLDQWRPPISRSTAAREEELRARPG
jgi:cholesterol oxidase